MKPKNKPKKEDKIAEIRSDEVQDILNHVPHWLIRWGISLVFLLLIIALAISWLIKYPDTVPGRITISTEKTPVKLTSTSRGQIRKLFVEDDAFVRKGDHLAEILSPVQKKDILLLQVYLRSLDSVVGQIDEQDVLMPIQPPAASLGDMQRTCNAVNESYQKLVNLLNDPNNRKSIYNLKSQITYQDELIQVSQRQLEIASKVLEKSRVKYQSDSALHAKQVISKMDLTQEAFNLHSKEQELERNRQSLIQNKITKSNQQKQLNDLNYKIETNKQALIRAIQSNIKSLENQIVMWEQNYIIKAPFDGKLSYLQNLTEDQFIESGKELFAVMPNANEYIGLVHAPSNGLGKVRPGQEVNIQLDNYPFNQYGLIKGEVMSIAPFPMKDEESGEVMYQIKVKLTKGMVTTYDKTLEFSPEMSGNAEIVTEDLRLIERIFYQLKKLTQN